jgi:hypothetical protein
MACLKIKVPADHIGKFDRFCFGIPKFDETAFGTSIAQGFPFFMAHLLKAFFFPKLVHFSSFLTAVG